MKSAIAILFVCLVHQVSGQEMSCEGGNAHLQQVVMVEGKTAAEIYKLANRWIAKNFHSKDKLIQSTIDNEMIRGDGYEVKLIKMAAFVFHDLSYSFTVDVKDGKMRILLNNFKLPTVGYKFETYCCKGEGQIRTNSQSQNMKESIEAFTKKLIESFNASLNDTDW